VTGRDISAAAWLRAHVPDTPPALMDAMLAALPSDGGDSIPDALAAGAMRLYAELRAGCAERADALPLLAADALLTHALQAQADADLDALPAFCERWGAAGALGQIATST
jgi:hypothetical protein